MSSEARLFMLPWQPWAKKRPAISRGGGRTHQPPDDRAAEKKTRDALAAMMADAGWEPYTGNVMISVQFYRATRQVVDLDNLLKHLLDCGNGVLWDDDRQITCYERVTLDVDRAHPHTTLTVSPDFHTTMLRGTDAK